MLTLKLEQSNCLSQGTCKKSTALFEKQSYVAQLFIYKQYPENH